MPPTREECIAAFAAVIFRAKVRIVREQIEAEQVDALDRAA